VTEIGTETEIFGTESVLLTCSSYSSEDCSACSSEDCCTTFDQKMEAQGILVCEVDANAPHV
jgi:hypothetical protein